MPSAEHYKRVNKKQYQTDFDVGMILPFVLRRLLHRHLCRIDHIFNENAIPSSGIVYEDMGDRSNELAVLDDGRAAQECGQ